MGLGDTIRKYALQNAVKYKGKANIGAVIGKVLAENPGLKKDMKKLAVTYDYFIAQATIMPKIATTFGKVFGPKGKMPNPKAGCVVPPNANLKPLVQKLKKTLKVKALADPIVHCCVGKEDSKEEEIIDNIMTVYNGVVHSLPQEANNIRNSYLKLTMGKSFKIGDKEKTEDVKGKKVPKEKKEAPKVKEKKEEKPVEERKEVKEDKKLSNESEKGLEKSEASKKE